MGRKKKSEKIVPYKDPHIYKKSRIPFHINYSMRMAFVFISFVFVVLLLSNFTKQIRNLNKDSKFKISENGYITYDVKLLKNDFYNESILGMDMAYVPILIDKVYLNFNYSLSSEDYLELSYENVIKYDFFVLNNVDNKVIYHVNSYEVKRHFLDREKSLKYQDVVEIDYNKYKSKYDELVLMYGENITGYINVSNTIDKSSDLSSLDGYIDDNFAYSVKIPITKDVFSINLNNDSKFRNKITVTKKDVAIIANRLIVLTIIVLSLLIILVFVAFVRLLSYIGPKRSKYDRVLNKLLKEYDNVIVETLIYPNEEGLKKISVDSFKEILDVHDLLHKPILYFNVVRHMKCIFYVLNDKDLYVYTLKEVDLEK